MKNSIKLILLVISALLFIGCAEAGELEEPEEVQLIETAGTNHFQAVGFSEYEINIIQKAADMWLPGFIKVDANVVEGGSKITLVEFDCLGYTEHYINRTEIEIKNSWVNNQAEWNIRLFKIMMHEFGHHIGYRYNDKTRGHLGSGNVMAQYYEWMVNIPTAADLEYTGLN